MATKIKQSPKLPAETRRLQLLDSARKLFVKKGFRMTSTEEIARNAGLTKGALYFHFKKKEDILFELIKKNWEHSDAAFSDQLKPGVHPAEMLNVLLNLHCNCELAEYWDMIDIWIQGIRIPRIKRYIKKRLTGAIKDIGELLSKELVPGKKARLQLTIMTFAMCDGMSFLKHLDPELVDHKAQVKLYKAMVDGMIAASAGGNK